MRREFDIVLYGATGFTGRRAARYFAERLPDGARLAIAGRSAQGLEALGLKVPTIVADIDRPEELLDLTRRTRVVATTAGPFRRVGDPLVAACLETGTHYCDISGETARIRDLIDRHHAEAEERRVRIVPFCGVSSLPVDLAVHLLDRSLPGPLTRASALIDLAGGMFNGGTVASIVESVESGDAAREADPFLLGPDDRTPTDREQDPTGLRYDTEVHAWVLASPTGVSDTRAVRRSSALDGRDTEFQEYLAFPGARSLPRAAATAATLGTAQTAFRFRWSRRLLTRLMPPGKGPTEKQIENGHFHATVLGNDAEGRTGTVRITGTGDPANRVTVTCLYASAALLALHEDELPQRYGVLTPGTALGAALVGPLTAAGMDITIRTA